MGFIGAVVALIINILYSVTYVLARVAGLTTDRSHFFLGLAVVIVGAGGAFLAPILPILAAVMLIAAGIAFFVVFGWWALSAFPFFLVAAVLTCGNRTVSIPAAD